MHSLLRRLRWTTFPTIVKKPYSNASADDRK
jgi:hypothetical protein